MPLLRYFFFVGGCLIALLFAANAYLPQAPDEARADADRPVIRIQSDQKWPARVVFDTNQPTIIPPQAKAGVPLATVADSGAHVRNAFAQLRPADQSQVQRADPKRLEKKVVHKRKFAKRRTAPPEMLVAQQPQFGFFSNNIW